MMFSFSRWSPFVLAALCAVPAASQAAPSAGAVWAYSAKTGVGTAYEPYVDGKSPGRSKVWFSIAGGILTETMYGLIHEAQIRSAQVVVKTRRGLVVEGEGTTARTYYLDHDPKTGAPDAPAYRVVTKDRAGEVEIEKRIFTDPDRNTLIMRVTVRSLKGGPVTPYVFVQPFMGGAAPDVTATASDKTLTAAARGVFVTVRERGGFAQGAAGVLGAADGLTELRSTGRLSAHDKAQGVVVVTGRLSSAFRKERTFDLAFGFGKSAQDSAAAADGSLKDGYATLLKRFVGGPDHPGWRTYLAGLSELPRLQAQSTDHGHLAAVSAMALKVQEDKTYSGALIASLSNPWGDTVPATAPSTGYKAVWPRDFYQCAMALAALGDKETPVAAFRYLRNVQVKASTPGAEGAFGWFQQKSHVDGQAEWKAVQLDQTAMPIMLGWSLWKRGLISEAELKARYADMIHPAADFLVTGGHVKLLDNSFDVKPLYTQQERWEEQEGYSPSTSAAVVAGLVTAGDVAELAGDAANASRYRAAADDFSSRLETLMFTNKGTYGDGRYYLRISTGATPDQPGLIAERNGKVPLTEDRVLDAGFLELVRYGVRRADDPHILLSLKVIDDETIKDHFRVRYTFRFKGDPTPHPGFRRYGHDGYGEDAETGGNYGATPGVMSPGQRGRVWPIFTGERGHYALALATVSGPPSAAAIDEIRKVYVTGMERFANEGLMLPEQVYEGVGVALGHPVAVGQGTNSATPLAWAHAEYVKLLRSLADGRVFDLYAPVQARYAK